MDLIKSGRYIDILVVLATLLVTLYKLYDSQSCKCQPYINPGIFVLSDFVSNRKSKNNYKIPLCMRVMALYNS